ncbi:la-related protein 1-like isoform X3 [Aethina tumida]|nr:la-related protein 1-like isoform X3 [Aethina tumida]
MKLLYRIWNFFLRFDFSDETYKEFKTLAWEDAEHDAYFSLKHLFRFFCFSLLITFRPNVLEDFQEFTILDCRKGRIYGLYMFWTFLKIHEGAHLLRIRPELQEYLDEFKSYRDFREARHREFSELDLKNIEYSKIIMQEHRSLHSDPHTHSGVLKYHLYLKNKVRQRLRREGCISKSSVYDVPQVFNW